MKCQIKSFSHVHGTGVHLRPMLHVPVHCLQHSPGAHGGGAASLVGKLKIIESKLDTIENNEKLVNKLQHNTADGNTPVIFADVNTA